jgi:glutamine amidotransferase
MIAIIDYNAGNLKSVEKALHFLGEDCVITRNFHEIETADKVILPGVGAFGDAMEQLKKYELDKVIHQVTAENKPFLGICLGLQGRVAVEHGRYSRRTAPFLSKAPPGASQGS